MTRGTVLSTDGCLLIIKIVADWGLEKASIQEAGYSLVRSQHTFFQSKSEANK